MTTLHLCLGERGYDINIGRGTLGSAGEIFNLNRRVFIVTDDGVPDEYAKTVEGLCEKAMIFTVKQGEDSKSPSVLVELLKKMLEFGMTRTDCVVAVGGGVVGDLAGFAAATYMRGIDFYNIPTTLLSQVDASVGGKTAINLCGVKNTVGAFKQPKAVLVDVGVLETLPKRHMRNGMAEVIKMAAVANEKLFAALENSSEEDTYNNIADIITEAVKIKRDIVEADEKESGLRKILNFGHTLGHAIEESERCDRLHGECVAIGMIPVSLADAKNRILSLLRKYSLPTSHDVDSELISRGIAHDKKAKGDKISIIFCPQIGKYCIKNMTVEEFNINNESDKQYDTLVDDMLKSYDEKCGDYIFDSRLAWHFVPSAVSFYLSADKEVAAKRVFDAMRADEHFASFEETLASLTSRRASERRRYYDYYKVDIMDMANYDCVIDTTNLCPEDVAERIIAFYMQKIGQ